MTVDAPPYLIDPHLWDDAIVTSANGVVGLDLSLTSTGLAYINDDGVILDFGTIGESGRKTATLYDREERITRTGNAIVEWVLADCTPRLAVVEAPSFGSSGGAAFDRAGLWWKVVATLRAYGVEVAQVAPRTRAKYATGDGNAGKPVVMAHVEHTYGEILPHALPLRSKGRDDVCDAIVLAAMGTRYLGTGIEPFGLSVKQLDAQAAVTWPVTL